MIIHTFNTYNCSCIYILLILILYYLCIDFVFQFIVEKYRNKLNQIKSNFELYAGTPVYNIHMTIVINATVILGHPVNYHPIL